MTHHINYSFAYRSGPDELYSVNVPLERFEDMELTLENVRNVIEEDMDLISELMGDELKSYESMVMAPHIYPKELQRFDESIRLVAVETEREGLDAGRAEAALRELISTHVDYDIHKNFECDEETGKDTYGELTEEFIKLYKK